jgi:hypothetical protein
MAQAVLFCFFLSVATRLAASHWSTIVLTDCKLIRGLVSTAVITRPSLLVIGGTLWGRRLDIGRALSAPLVSAFFTGALMPIRVPFEFGKGTQRLVHTATRAFPFAILVWITMLFVAVRGGNAKTNNSQSDLGAE